MAAALLQDQDFAALVDPGPGSTIHALRQRLAAHGIRVSDLSAIFLTHIHLDHAGATGALVQENPDLKVYVHQRGAPHMADPAVLLKSAGRLYGDQMGPLFGDFLPVPESNMVVLQGGEILKPGPFELRVLYTPGHASHHVTYFETSNKVAFVGDTAGISIEGHPFILPATPPPDISLELWNSSLDAISQLHAERLFLTHFGFSDSPERHLQTYREQLQHWSELSEEILFRAADEDAGMKSFVDSVAAEASVTLSPEEVSHYVFNGALNLSWLGLVRYHRKRQLPKP